MDHSIQGSTALPTAGGKVKTATPETGKFSLVLRIYAPRQTPPSILDGSWTPPPVQRVP